MEEYSNINRSDLAQKRRAQLDQQKCPVCNASRERRYLMGNLEDQIITWLRDNNVTPFDSCILCVEKHVGRAVILWEELLSAKQSGTEDGTARVNIYKNHIKILGHLGNAYDESADYSELHDFLKIAERNYRYEGTAPDWPTLLALMEAVKTPEVDHADD